MKNNNLTTLVVTILLGLTSCYLGKKVMATYPNGQVKAERHYKLHDSLNEIYIQYYANGQKAYADYWHNRHAAWAMNKEYEWYENGKKKSELHRKYKDTILVFDSNDSNYIFKGLCRETSVLYNPKGEIISRCYIKRNKRYCEIWNETKDTLIDRSITTVRPDGYDTINERMFIKNK